MVQDPQRMTILADTSDDKAKAYTQVTDLSGTVRCMSPSGRLTVERDSGDGGPRRVVPVWVPVLWPLIVRAICIMQTR